GLVKRGHEVRAAVAGDDDRAAGVAQAGALAPAPAARAAVDQPGGEGVAGTEDVDDGDGEAGGVDRLAVWQMHARPPRAALDDEHRPRRAAAQAFHGAAEVAAHLGRRDLLVRDPHVRLRLQRRGAELLL